MAGLVGLSTCIFLLGTFFVPHNTHSPFTGIVSFYYYVCLEVALFFHNSIFVVACGLLYCLSVSIHIFSTINVVNFFRSFVVSPSNPASVACAYFKLNSHHAHSHLFTFMWLAYALASVMWTNAMAFSSMIQPYNYRRSRHCLPRVCCTAYARFNSKNTRWLC